MAGWGSHRTARSARRLVLAALLGVLALGAWGAYAVFAASGPSTPTITPTPSTSPTNSATESLAFTSSKDATSLQCSLNGSAFAACTSPKVYGTPSSPLAEGAYTFQVKALDKNNNASAAATYSWTVDRDEADGSVLRPYLRRSSRTRRLSPGRSRSASPYKSLAASNFSVVQGGGIIGTPAVTNVSGSGATWTVACVDGEQHTDVGIVRVVSAVEPEQHRVDHRPRGQRPRCDVQRWRSDPIEIHIHKAASILRPFLGAKPPDPNGTATSTFAWSDGVSGPHLPGAASITGRSSRRCRRSASPLSRAVRR